MLHMVVEQTSDYPMRMEYVPELNGFRARDCRSLAAERNFTKPYGWIRESGAPPDPHWDCILMSDRCFELGEEIPIKVIGMFKRADKDHKYVVVECGCEILDIAELPECDKEELYRLYPRVRDGEGWYGREEAITCMERDEKVI